MSPLARAPRLALVLGSGGVKSIAGLGLAQALAARGWRADVVAGSSAGAIFGALIARGDEPLRAIEIATRLWSREVTSRTRRVAWAQLALPRLAGFGDRFAMRDDRLIVERLERAFGDQRLEQLPTPLVVAATDAVTGQAVWLRSGRIVDALRATVALPFLFAPWPMQGRLLIDGSIADPLPLAAVADADQAVALGFDCPMPERVDRPGRLAVRMVASLTNNLMQARIAAADPARCHVVIARPQRRIGLFDTHAMPELVALGREHGEQMARQLAERAAPARARAA